MALAYLSYPQKERRVMDRHIIAIQGFDLEVYLSSGNHEFANDALINLSSACLT